VTGAELWVRSVNSLTQAKGRLELGAPPAISLRVPNFSVPQPTQQQAYAGPPKTDAGLPEESCCWHPTHIAGGVIEEKDETFLPLLCVGGRGGVR